MELAAYQRRVKATDTKRSMLVSLAGLVGEVGSIVSAYKNRGLLARHIPSLKRELAEELGDALWYLTSIANAAHLSLNKIAKENIEKAEWLNDAGKPSRFDAGFPKDERFPRKFSVRFTEKVIRKRNAIQVKISVRDVIVGDHLTDNSYDQDGYRYHDVFHLAYAAILGWSPVIRALLKRKRKSDSRIDEIEDGARAIAIEEAISIFVFNHAKQLDFFSDPKAIGPGLLRKVKDIAGNLQVKQCSAKQWEQAVVRGYAVFRELCNNKGGIVHVDLDKRDIWYEPVRDEAMPKKAVKNPNGRRTANGGN